MALTETPGTVQYTCPRCGWTGEFDGRFARWCIANDHGLIAEDEQQRLAAQPRRVRRKREKSRRRAEALQERLTRADNLRPGGGARFAAIVFGAAIHALTLAVFVGAVALLLTGIWPLYIVAALGFGIVWVLRPRIDRRPGTGWLKRTKLPKLFAVLDAVGEATGAPTPKYVRIDARFNAGTSRHGVRHEPVLVLGAPLWQILDGGERLALLGHELGHQVNGDTTQSVLVTTARRSLHEWRMMFHPGAAPGPRRRMSPGVAGLAELLVPVILLPFYLLLTGLQQVYGWLQVHVSLRAEFLADDIAARTASTASALALIRKLGTGPSVAAYVTRTKLGRGSSRKAPSVEDAMEMWIGLQDYMRTIPEHEYVRAARISEFHGTQIDASHPAHYLRARLLQGRPEHQAAVTITEDEWLAVDVELASYVAEIGRAILR